MKKQLEVKAEGKKVYDIVIRDSFDGLAEEMKDFGIQKKRLCIVTESRVGAIYLTKIVALLEPLCRKVEVFVFPEGEDSKNLHTVNQLYQFLIEKEFDRKDMLIALGGGVAGDLTGFAAATYLRGIDFVQVPTSLLAQVDSSIGGKTGVDFQSYKNMVGAFYMPKLVYININTIQSLPERQFQSGLGEVIKHGLIRDKHYFEWVRANKEAIARRDPESLAVVVEGSCKIKRAVVEEDPKEQGVRACLNFGHTFGHSIEKLMNFQLTHGECVGIGCVLASAMSCRRGYITEEEYEDIKELFAYFHFPELPESLDPSEIIREMRHDKKMEHGRIKFIMLQKVGEAKIYTDVTEEEMSYPFQVAAVPEKTISSAETGLTENSPQGTAGIS
ncbi:MAG: 3-dehydroquinate synthase [Clostridiales bacterium]|nr:3-dehydroquinate synthase [Clostridiales bacterium]